MASKVQLGPALLLTGQDKLTFSGKGTGCAAKACNFFGSGESLCELFTLLFADGVVGSSTAFRLESVVYIVNDRTLYTMGGATDFRLSRVPFRSVAMLLLMSQMSSLLS